ncbi:unnamed protein product [Prunus armeniaca]
MSAPRSLSVSSHKEMRPVKETELSGVAKKSRHAPQVVLGLGSPNIASASSAPSRPQQVSHAPTPASSLGENDFTAMNDEQMWGYQSQCLSATATLELSGKRIKEYLTELEQQWGELQNLRCGQSTALVEVDRIK